jgi:hypothetical protein
LARPAFAEQRMWVSAFVMKLSELVAFSKRWAPEEYALFRQRLLEQRPELGGIPEKDLYDFGVRHWWLFFRANQDVFERMRVQLHRFDFTVPGFKRVVRELLLRELATLYATDRGAYAEAVAELRAEPQTVIKRLVYERHGFPRIEAKAPELMPVGTFSVVKAE